MKAFVTGSTGLLGNSLVRLLSEQGHTVKALARSKAKAAKVFAGLHVEVVEGDMADVAGFASALDGFDVLFHTAAYFREYYQPGNHWEKLKRINVDGTVQLLEEAARRGVTKTIYTSSAGVIGQPTAGQMADESTTPAVIADNNLYFKSKVLAEVAVGEFVRTHTMPVVLILPGWMFGPSDSAPTGSGQLVLDFLARKIPGIIPGGAAVADARDVAQAMINAVEHGRNGERYIVAGAATSLEQIMRTLEQISGIPAPRLRIPYPIALGIAWVSENYARLTDSATLITLEGVRTMHAHTPISSAKAMRELGVTFRPLEETLRDEVSWYREHGYAPASEHNAKLKSESATKA